MNQQQLYVDNLFIILVIFKELSFLNVRICCFLNPFRFRTAGQIEADWTHTSLALYRPINLSVN